MYIYLQRGRVTHTQTEVHRKRSARCHLLWKSFAVEFIAVEIIAVKIIAVEIMAVEIIAVESIAVEILVLRGCSLIFIDFH